MSERRCAHGWAARALRENVSGTKEDQGKSFCCLLKNAGTTVEEGGFSRPMNATIVQASAPV
jgi:hypothetical protein